MVHNGKRNLKFYTIRAPGVDILLKAGDLTSTLCSAVRLRKHNGIFISNNTVRMKDIQRF